MMLRASRVPLPSSIPSRARIVRPAAGRRPILGIAAVVLIAVSVAAILVLAIREPADGAEPSPTGQARLVKDINGMGGGSGADQRAPRRSGALPRTLDLN